ncbi:transposase [Vibrio campbellii]|uniref:transposase n=1 Tax=Vibrio campbellii TaxID=680 RepID=UPI00210B2C19|nr:transposase [Vibrio campbellii]
MTASTNYIAEIERLHAQLAEKELQLQSQSNKLQTLSSRVEILEEVVRYLKIKRFMPSSEKTNVDQFLLFDEAELCTDPKVEQHEKDQDKKVVKGATPSLVAASLYRLTCRVNKSSFT